MGRKKLFSLIEIAVAMAVAAFGVAAIMALLPVAVKSTNDSVGDTLATDVVNTVIAQLDRGSWEHFEWLQNLKTTKPKGTDFSPSELKNYRETKLDSESGAKVSSYKFVPAAGPFNDNGKCLFLYGAPGNNPDFMAEVLCWKEDSGNLKLTTIKPRAGKVQTPSSDKISSVSYPEESGKKGNPFVRVYIEITWPITKSYKDGGRQSRLFVREYLDPAYFKPES